MKHQLRKSVFLLLCALVSIGIKAQVQDTARYVKWAKSPIESEEVISTETYPLANQRDTVVETTKTTFLTYNDTLVTMVTSYDSIVHADTVVDLLPEPYHKGHHIEAYIGGGYSSLGYRLTDGQNPTGTVAGGGQALIQLQYAYFFAQQWGLGIGASFSNLTSHARPTGSRIWNGVTDSDGEIYNHTTNINRWNERQTIHALSVPVSVQFQHFYQPDRGVFFDLGAAPQFTFQKLNQFNVLDGELEHSGYYEWSRLTLENLYTHEFVKQNQQAQGEVAARRISAAVFADLGFLFTINKRLDFYAGAYGYCNVLDANVSEKKELGWKTDDYTFMEDYSGMYATTEAGKSIPWAVGVKVGIHWHHIPKPKGHIERWAEPLTERDTTESLVVRNDTVEEFFNDTIYTIVVVQPEQTETEGVMFKHIYFDINKFDIRQDNVDNMIEILRYLRNHPNARIIVTGHACKLGKNAYNNKLSRYRAIMVARWFQWRGIDPKRIETRSYGSQHPSTTGEHDLKLDRRVEVTVVEEE